MEERPECMVKLHRDMAGYSLSQGQDKHRDSSRATSPPAPIRGCRVTPAPGALLKDTPAELKWCDPANTPEPMDKSTFVLKAHLLGNLVKCQLVLDQQCFA
jgi:hypothetical protein